jgi:hypothetical protein
MSLLTISTVGHRRHFPAWIESDDGVPALALAGTIVLPRVRAALPLRRVLANALSSASASRKPSDARRLR